MPIVFTSAIALDSQEPEFWRDATLVHGLTQTPQVWIDCQALVANGALMVNWDVRDGVFPDGLIDDMFAAFERLLHSLADDADAWDRPVLLPLPPAQAERRRAANATATAAVRRTDCCMSRSCGRPFARLTGRPSRAPGRPYLRRTPAPGGEPRDRSWRRAEPGPTHRSRSSPTGDRTRSSACSACCSPVRRTCRSTPTSPLCGATACSLTPV